VNDRALNIPVEQILEPRTLLRLVNRDSIEYMEMRDSLIANGFLNSISVRPAKQPDMYEIIDGLYRFTISREIGRKTIPCIIKEDVDDDKFLEMQLQANAQRPLTTPAEFANQMRKMLTRKPEMTFDELGHLIKKSPKWIGERLGLLKLNVDARKMVDRGEMPLSSAYMLAKIPKHLQAKYYDSARTLPAKQFNALAAGVIKTYTEAVKLGKMEAFWTTEFKPHPYLRSLRDVVSEIENKQAGHLIVVAENCKTAIDGLDMPTNSGTKIEVLSTSLICSVKLPNFQSDFQFLILIPV